TLEGLHHQLDAGRVAHEPVWPEADRGLLEAVQADLLHVLLGRDPSGRGCQRAVERHEVGPRLLKLEPDPVTIDDDDLADLLLEDLSALGPPEAELDVLGGE